MFPKLLKLSRCFTTRSNGEVPTDASYLTYRDSRHKFRLFARIPSFNPSTTSTSTILPNTTRCRLHKLSQPIPLNLNDSSLHHIVFLDQSSSSQQLRSLPFVQTTDNTPQRHRTLTQFRVSCWHVMWLSYRR
jgi:hypothetical protein